MALTTAVVDLGAIRRNIAALRVKVGPNVRLMPVVKANAYGHGAVQVAHAVVQAGTDMLAVARVEEAVELREAGVAAPILILGYAPLDAVPEIVARDITATICDRTFAEALSKCAVSQRKKVTVHVKVDTGMGRIGLPSKSAADFILAITNLPGLKLEGIFTHFPSADEDDGGFTDRQVTLFRQLLQSLESRNARPPIAHAANSGGILNHPDSWLDMIRPGLLTYGIYPCSDLSKSVVVEPALTLKTSISFCKVIDPGETVSYGRTFRAKRKTRVATIPTGYADGFSRDLSNRGFAIVRGKKVPVIGRVCMDQSMLDVSEITNPCVGEEVIIYGSQGGERITVEEVAEIVGTVPHDVLCAISQRVPRVYVDGLMV